MKQYLPAALALVCLVLIISIFVVKRSDNAQHETDDGTIASFSNQLAAAHLQIAFCKGTMFTLSNRLDEGQSASLTLSNHLTKAESSLALAAEQITNLNQQVAEVQSANQTLSRQVMDLTNQVAGFSKQLTLAGANLTRTNEALVEADKNYALLENRLRQDVAARVVMERKFNNLSALQTQMQKLADNPSRTISDQSIYADLDVEVDSNGTFHVVSQN
jgi:chromosome segregation ATPase